MVADGLSVWRRRPAPLGVAAADGFGGPFQGDPRYCRNCHIDHDAGRDGAWHSDGFCDAPCAQRYHDASSSRPDTKRRREATAGWWRTLVPKKASSLEEVGADGKAPPETAGADEGTANAPAAAPITFSFGFEA